MLYFTSDLHLFHNKEFLFKPRGFKNVKDMSRSIIDNINSVVTENDELYILGDLMLNGDEGIELIKQIKCPIHIIIGNHDTDRRCSLYHEIPNIVEVTYAAMLKYKKYHFFLTHYPTAVINSDDKYLTTGIINLYGHTHQNENFYNNNPRMYHVGLDSHNCNIVSIEDIIEDCKKRYQEQLAGVNSYDKALEFCIKAHFNQTDKSGAPYIMHPLSVAGQLMSYKAKLVALMHDVIEDSDYTLEDLKPYFTEDILETLDLLTHKKNIPYFDYITAIKTNKLATTVKLADLSHNMDISRIENPTEKDYQRTEKYKKAYEILSEDL